MHHAMHDQGLPQPLLIRIIATQFPNTKWGCECLSLIGGRRTATTALRMQRLPDLPGNAYVAIRTINGIITAFRRPPREVPSSANDGGCVFAANPDQSFSEQTVFWAPEALPTVIPVRPALRSGADTHVSLKLGQLTAGELRQAPDGWYAVLYLRGVEHRLWLKETPVIAEAYAVELQLDRDFEFRAHAARRLWRTLNVRPPGPPLHVFSAQRRRRLALALRALDARMDGSTYREIAEVLFGARQIPERAWKTHDLRNRTIRLVQTGFALMRGGYRALLRPPPRKK